MSSYTFPFSSAPTKSVKHISFGILSPEEIIGNSVAKIEYVEMYENKQPKIGGLSDPRMGCVERNLKCYTCDEIINDCPGHFGHIELNAAMYHIGFIKYVKKILECICPKCSRLRILPSDPKFKKIVVSKNRFQTAWDICKSRTVCEYEDCETQLLPLRKLGYKLYYDVKKTTKNQDKIYLFADEAHKILSRMTDETCIQIGLNPKTSHPENMIITVLPVPPPCIRPSVKVDNTDNRGEDDLTSVLVNIIRCNNDLLKVKRGSDNMVSVKENLQNQIVAYIDNDLKTGIKRNVLRGSRVTKSLTSRLKGKEGRVRSNLMGKRVDFSARTVITGDPNISIEQLGVPRTIAQNLTVPIKAFNLNLDELQDMVNNSPEYPSAKYIVKVNGTRIDLRFAKRKPIVDIGDTIERHLRDGDVVLFNRQPTLHKMSMMAHTVKVMPYSTFRMNVTTTASYNADFDGDEMNVHVPQSLETIAELYELSRVSKCLVSAQSNKPVNSLVQDSVTSIRLFTLRDNFLRREEVMNLLYRIDRDVDMPPPAIFKPVPLWTGKQLFSLLMPKINMSGFHSAHPDDESGMTSIGDTRVIIQNGVLVSGIICKKTVGTSSGGILHIIFNDYGSEYAMKFLDETSQLLNEWLLHRGFSVGIGDAIIDSQVSDKMNMINQDMNEKVQDIINQYTSGELKSQGTLSVSETKESAIQTILANTRDESGRLVYKVAESRMNNVKQMIESGAKGNIMNICQISACVGQQIIQGKRISFGFKKRTLPCYEFNDDSPESRGYVKNSFLRGLSPQEMFFHAMGGREGVIDTAVKTAETGYIQRRLIKAMEDLVIKTDGTVRDSNNDIIQFQYGEDGIDGVFIEWNTFPTVLLSNDEFEKKYKGENDQEWQILVSDRNKLRDLLEKEDRIPMPLNLKRILINFENKFNERSGSSESSVSSVTADYVYEKLVNLRNLLCKRKTYLFGALLFSYLSWKQVNKFTKEQFDEILDFVHDKYDRASIPYGENVGVIAAQSIGEPATQMTLNSVEWNTQILICVNGSLQKIEIGKYIDNYFNNVSEESIKKYENNQWYTSTLEDIIEIPSCDSDGNVSWKRIEAITKHPVINEDGTDTLLKVTLASGRSVTATKGKSFLKRIDNKILPVNGSDLKIGDHLPISKSLVVSTKEEYMYFDEKFGLLCGIYLADNDTVNNEMKKWFNTKSIPIEFFQAPREFLIGLISGFFKHTTNVINNVYLLEDLIQLLKIFEF
jgi:DNA-directed RNA polymerase II subunit RPB1